MPHLKRLLLFILVNCFTFCLLKAQVPQGINYQAVARTSTGNLLLETPISVDFSLHADNASGPIMYAETHADTTNGFGLFTLVIGQGTPISGLFSDLDWSGTQYFLGVAIDGNSIGTTQLLSVPYALAVAPRKQYYSIPGAVFNINNNEGVFRTSLGAGGAEITQTGGSFTNVLNAQVNLPHGARIDSFRVFFQDASDVDLNISLQRESLTRGNFSRVTSITTSGNMVGWRSVAIAVSHTVDNIGFGYLIRVFCSDWNAIGIKSIKGVLIEYTY
ncbi:MAG: hypothetical protein AAF696_00045 [Bacteroidota bacterium]